jgi:hypothetical protein
VYYQIRAQICILQKVAETTGGLLEHEGCIMLKLIGHAVVFVIGAGSGVYWGVHHPVAAANISDTESAQIQQAVAAAKAELLQQMVADQTAAPDQPASVQAQHLSKYQQLLQTARQDLNAATAKLNGQ